MKIEISQSNGINVAEVISESIVINNVQDALDLIANCGYQGADRMILYEKNITPAFFDLKTGIAGEVLQKFSTYQMSVAVVGDFSKYTSKSLRDFIYESSKGNRVNFLTSGIIAKEKLTSTSN